LSKKEKFKTGSVLILRFFHGIFPTNRIDIRASRAAVSEMIKLARAEAKLFLQDPSALVLCHRARWLNKVRLRTIRTPTGFSEI